MNIVMEIDGMAATGVYRARCSCTTYWSGSTDKDDCGVYCPALPVAECAAHFLMDHSGSGLEVRWTHSFSTWLQDYWQRQSLLQATAFEGSLG